jgi:hypothetical protein
LVLAELLALAALQLEQMAVTQFLALLHLQAAATVDLLLLQLTEPLVVLVAVRVKAVEPQEQVARELLTKAAQVEITSKAEQMVAAVAAVQVLLVQMEQLVAAVTAATVLPLQ